MISHILERETVTICYSVLKEWYRGIALSPSEGFVQFGPVKESSLWGDGTHINMFVLLNH